VKLKLEKLVTAQCWEIWANVKYMLLAGKDTVAWRKFAIYTECCVVQ